MYGVVFEVEWVFAADCVCACRTCVCKVQSWIFSCCISLLVVTAGTAAIYFQMHWPNPNLSLFCGTGYRVGYSVETAYSD